MAEQVNSLLFEITDEMRRFEPSEREREVVSDTFANFSQVQEERNRNYEYFDGIDITTYIEESVRRFTTNVDERDNLEDWQARVFDPFTRNKVLAIAGKVAAVMPIAQFEPAGDEDIRKANILTNLYNVAEEEDGYEELMYHVLLEAIVKGTAIGYEGVERKNIVHRDVRGTDDNIRVTEKETVQTRLPGTIVPLEEFYPASVGIRNIDKMPFCFWRKEIPFSKFQQDWGMFDKSRFVQPAFRFAEEEDRPFYADFITDETGEANVEIIRYYDKHNDQYIILANGVWLNPITVGDDQEEISPLPFNHKELPFWTVKFDVFGDFFYGKSLPDRIKSLQDVLNVLTNMLLDQSFLTIFPPILTNGYDSIEDDYLRPGRRTPVDTQGLPIDQAYQTLNLGTPSGWHQFILDYTRGIMEEASVDQVSQGVAGVGGRTTAAEIRTAAEGVSDILSLFSRMFRFGLKRKAFLKGANILQFWTDPKSPRIQQIRGEGANEEFNEIFNTFEVNNAVLSSGERGTKIIELYTDKKNLPTSKELQARGIVASKASNKPVEIDALPGQYIRDFKYDVKLVPNPLNEQTKDLEKALHLEKVRVYMSFFPQIVNVQELAAQTADKFGDDPTKVLNEEVFQPVPQEPGREVDNGLSTEPTQNTANNLARSAGGGEGGNQQLAQLQANLTG